MSNNELHPSLRANHDACGFERVYSEEMRRACNVFLKSRGLLVEEYYGESAEQIQKRKKIQTLAPVRPRK